MSKNIGADIDGYLECTRGNLKDLASIAEKVDQFVDAEPPQSGYDLPKSMAAILNGGTEEQIRAAFGLLAGWSFKPKEG